MGINTIVITKISMFSLPYLLLGFFVGKLLALHRPGVLRAVYLFIVYSVTSVVLVFSISLIEGGLGIGSLFGIVLGYFPGLLVSMFVLHRSDKVKLTSKKITDETY